MPADLSETVTDAAEGPRKASGDAGSYESHSLPDLIKADQYTKASTGAEKPHRGLRFTKLIPPGASC